MARLEDVEPVVPHSLAYGNLFLSPLGREHQAPQHPLVIYGHDALDTAAFIAQASTLCTLAVQSIGNLEKALAATACIGIFAMSRPDHSGEAAKAIDTFEQNSAGPGVKLYGAWSHDVEGAIRQAVECGAHGVVMPDVDVQEWFDYMYALLQAVGENQPLPRTADAIRQHLQVAFSNSPFWQQKDDSVPAIT